MGCDDYPRPERDIAYDETLKLVGQLTGVASYGRDLLKAYQQRGTELAKLRAELADERATAVEAAKSYNASCSALVHERDALLAENADLRRLCADEHSREGQATDRDTSESGETTEAYRKVQDAVREALRDLSDADEAVDLITDTAIEYAELDHKVSCPDCAQWSWHGPHAERKMIEHYLKVHTAGGPDTWAPREGGKVEYSCGCKILSDDPGNVVLFECTLLDGHDGPHQDRGHTWENHLSPSDVPGRLCSAVPEMQGWNANGRMRCELQVGHGGPHEYEGGVFKWDKAYVPPPAESQPVQVREEAARRLRAAASALPVELNCTGISLRRLAQWLEEQRPPVDTPARDAVARALVPAEVDNPVRIADRLQGFKAVQVLRELTQWRSDFHAIDITRGSGRFSRVKEALVELEFIADRAVRVLGETK